MHVLKWHYLLKCFVIQLIICTKIDDYVLSEFLSYVMQPFWSINCVVIAWLRTKPISINLNVTTFTWARLSGIWLPTSSQNLIYWSSYNFVGDWYVCETVYLLIHSFINLSLQIGCKVGNFAFANISKSSKSPYCRFGHHVMKIGLIYS